MCDPSMMGGYWPLWGWLPMLLGTILGLALLALLGWLVFRLLSGLNTTRPINPLNREPADHRAALDILEQRYARGEIDPQAFERMRAQIQGATAPAGNAQHAW